MSDFKMNESTLKPVNEKYELLFYGYRFNFEGLKEKINEGFVQLVKGMGAVVSKYAQVTFVKKSYFEKKEKITKNNYYDIDYLMEAVGNVDPSNLHKYKLVPSHNQLSYGNKINDNELWSLPNGKNRKSKNNSSKKIELSEFEEDSDDEEFSKYSNDENKNSPRKKFKHSTNLYESKSCAIDVEKKSSKSNKLQP